MAEKWLLYGSPTNLHLSLFFARVVGDTTSACNSVLCHNRLSLRTWQPTILLQGCNQFARALSCRTLITQLFSAQPTARRREMVFYCSICKAFACIHIQIHAHSPVTPCTLAFTTTQHPDLHVHALSPYLRFKLILQLPLPPSYLVLKKNCFSWKPVQVPS